jgi:hypothetical protein
MATAQPCLHGTSGTRFWAWLVSSTTADEEEDDHKKKEKKKEKSA